MEGMISIGIWLFIFIVLFIILIYKDVVNFIKKLLR